MAEIVRLENVVKFYPPGRWALTGVDLSMEEGETVAVCGGPGSGKTTLLKIIGGLEKPSEGGIWIRGKPLHRMGPRETMRFQSRHIALLRRRPGFVPFLNVGENIVLPLSVKREEKRDDADRFYRWMKGLGLLKWTYTAPDRLDVPKRQRADLARAMVAEPELILADEVLGDLDSKEAEEFLELLLESVKLTGAALLYCTQDREIAKRIKRTMELKDGRLRIFQER